MQCMAKVTNSKQTTPILFPKLERKKEHKVFYIVPTYIPINKFLYIIHKSEKLRKRRKL